MCLKEKKNKKNKARSRKQALLFVSIAAQLIRFFTHCLAFSIFHPCCRCSGSLAGPACKVHSATLTCCWSDIGPRVSIVCSWIVEAFSTSFNGLQLLRKKTVQKKISADSCWRWSRGALRCTVATDLEYVRLEQSHALFLTLIIRLVRPLGRHGLRRPIASPCTCAASSAAESDLSRRRKVSYPAWTALAGYSYRSHGDCGGQNGKKNLKLRGTNSHLGDVFI